MKNRNLFLKSTIYLIVGGFVTRALGFIIKIVYTRIIKDEGITLLTLIMPTYSLLVTIASMAFPVTLAKLVAEGKKRSINILSNAIFISLITNILIIILLRYSSTYIANYLLHNSETKDLLITMSYVFPFISIGSIIKGYFIGKQKMLPYMISNILEQVLRLFLIIMIVPCLYKISMQMAVKGIILISIITELFSIVIFMFFLPKKVYINIDSIVLKREISKDILAISLPTVSGRIIGNIGYFLEPIILTTLSNNNSILLEYGVYNAYVLSILTLPAFLISALCNSLVPEISKNIHLNRRKLVKKRILVSLLPTLIAGIFISFIIMFFRYPLLSLLYNTTKGANYIIILAPFFPLFYIENIFYSILQASGNSKKSALISLIGVLIKTLVLIVLSILKYGIYSLIIAEIINILIVNYLCFTQIKKDNLI
jgi:stage V sporulation protein B